VAVLDRQYEYAQEISARYGGRQYLEIEALLEDPDVDVVYVLTRHDSHAGYIRKALAANKHVFCEKPLALTLEDALDIQQIAQASSRHLMVGFNHRWNPAIRWALEWLASSTTPVYSVQLTFATAPFLASWAGLEGEGGGVLPCLGSHALDLACEFLGEVPIRIAALTTRLRLPDPYLADTAGVLLQTHRGAICNLTFHDHATPSYQNYALPGSSHLLRAEIFGAGWSIVIDHSHCIHLFTESIQTISMEATDPLETLGILPEDTYFIDCLQNGKRPAPDERDGVRAVQLVGLASLAARTGRTLRVKDVFKPAKKAEWKGE
jgi:predicted dehydrogenase